MAEPAIDRFRRRQVPDVAGRFLKYRRACERNAELTWLGAMAQFSDHELGLLNDLGYLSQRDLDLLHAAGRNTASCPKRQTGSVQERVRTDDESG